MFSTILSGFVQIIPHRLVFILLISHNVSLCCCAVTTLDFQETGTGVLCEISHAAKLQKITETTKWDYRSNAVEGGGFEGEENLNIAIPNNDCLGRSIVLPCLCDSNDMSKVTGNNREYQMVT